MKVLNEIQGSADAEKMSCPETSLQAKFQLKDKLKNVWKKL